MRIIITVLFLTLIISNIYSQEIKIIEGVRIKLKDELKSQFIENINGFLTSKNQDSTMNKYVDPQNYTTYKEIFDELKNIELDVESADSIYYQPYLINFVSHSDTTHLITISFRSIDREKARIDLLALNREGQFVFLNPFEFNVQDWNTERIGDIQFYFRGKLNYSQAKDFEKHNTLLANFFSISPYSIKYFKCRDLQEVYQLFGITYHIDITGIKRGCVTITNENIFVSGTNSDEYKHDLTHFYFGLQIPKEKRNWVAEEGYNINLTDYWGFSTEDNYTFLKEYLKNNDVTPLEIFENNRIMRSPIPTKMPVAAVILRMIEREYGKDGILKMIGCGNTDDDFFSALESLTGITKQNFNEAVYTELGLK